jgi:hypothetical protein
MNQARYYTDPTDATLLLSRKWTATELSTFNQEQVQKVTDEAQLRAAIAARVAALQSAVTAATSFQTGETALAATVAAISPTTITNTQVRDQIALLHTDNASVAGDLILALNAVSDLAALVATTL